MKTNQNDKIKVLHVTASLRMGGAENLILGLLENVNNKDVETHLFMFGKSEDNVQWDDFLKLSIPYRWLDVSKFYNPRILIELIGYIRQNQIDIIHTHLCDGDIVGRIAGWLLGIPVISTLQNAPKDFLSYRFDRRILAIGTARFLGQHMVAVSDTIKNQFAEEWQIPFERLTTITNAVDIDRFLPTGKQKLAQPDNRPFTIINIGRLVPQKAQHVLLKAGSQLLKENINFEIWIVGDGELKDQLLALSKELNLTENVKFLGLRRDISELLKKADVFTLSSDWEGLPLSAIEAMAAGCPAVLTDVGGNAELVQDGKNGYLVPPNQPDLLARAYLRLYSDEHHRFVMGQAAQASVENKFHIKAIAQQYERLYKKLNRKSDFSEMVTQGV